MVGSRERNNEGTIQTSRWDLKGGLDTVPPREGQGGDHEQQSHLFELQIIHFPN